MNINKIEMTLLESEVDIILDALMEYCNLVNEKYNFRKISKSENETNEKYSIRNLYEHIKYCKTDKKQADDISIIETKRVVYKY